MRDESPGEASWHVDSMPWTFGLIALALGVIVDLFHIGPASESTSGVTVAAALLLIAVGGWNIGRRMGGWHGVVVTGAAAVMFAIKASDIVTYSPLFDDSNSMALLHGAENYTYGIAWVALAAALASRAWRRGGGRLSAIALLVSAPLATANQPRDDERGHWLRGATAIFRFGVASLLSCASSLVIYLANLVAPRGFVDALAHLGISANNVSAILTLWMLYQLAVVANLEFDKAPRIRTAISLFASAWGAAFILAIIFNTRWMLTGDSVGDHAATTLTVAFVKLLFIVLAIGNVAWSSAITSIGRRDGDSPKSLTYLGIVIAVLVIADTALRFASYMPFMFEHTTASFRIDMFLSSTWAFLLAVQCFRVATLMKHNAPPSMPAAVAIKRHSDP